MKELNEFAAILTTQEPLAPLTRLKVGGPAEFVARPTSVSELERLWAKCRESKIPCRLLGAGTNVLIPDDGVAGVVVLLTEPAFLQVTLTGNQVKAGAGVTLTDLINFACKNSLSGLEILAGIPGTVGGAIRCNAGTRAGDIGQFVRSVEVIDANGLATRDRSEIRFGERSSNLDDAVLVSAIFDQVPDQADEIARRLKKVWITKTARQPFDFQAAGQAFRSTRGLGAVELIEKAGMRGAKVGPAELSERDPSYIVAGPGTTARDIHRLLDLIVAKVQEKTSVTLKVMFDLW